jgi:hypothetical protein
MYDLIGVQTPPINGYLKNAFASGARVREAAVSKMGIVRTERGCWILLEVEFNDLDAVIAAMPSPCRNNSA